MPVGMSHRNARNHIADTSTAPPAPLGQEGQKERTRKRGRQRGRGYRTRRHQRRNFSARPAGPAERQIDEYNEYIDDISLYPGPNEGNNGNIASNGESTDRDNFGWSFADDDDPDDTYLFYQPI